MVSDVAERTGCQGDGFSASLGYQLFQFLRVIDRVPAGLRSNVYKRSAMVIDGESNSDLSHDYNS